MGPLGKNQLHWLLVLGSPARRVVTGDRAVRSLVKRGLLKAAGSDGDSIFQITPDGLRALADAHERGDLEQFYDKRLTGAKR